MRDATAPRARPQPQLLYLRHMCLFHHAGNLLKGTPTQLSAKLDIPEVVLRHLLEVGPIALSCCFLRCSRAAGLACSCLFLFFLVRSMDAAKKNFSHNTSS